MIFITAAFFVISFTFFEEMKSLNSLGLFFPHLCGPNSSSLRLMSVCLTLMPPYISLRGR